MKSLLGVITIICFVSTYGEALTCDVQDSGLTICRESDIITSVAGDTHEYSLTIKDPKGIASNAFKDLDIQTLEITHSHVDYRHLGPSAPITEVSLKSGSFNGLGNLTDLYIYQSKLVYETNPLLPLTKLERLRLLGCALTEVPSDLFSGVSNLKDLVLVEHDIPVIRANAFAALKNLKELTFKANNITTLEPGCFNGLDELTILRFSSNQLTLTPNIFSPLKKLEKLGLYDAVRLGGFHTQAFRGLPNLISLEFITYDNTPLEPGMFDDSTKLRHIELDHSKISHIPKNVFNNLQSLRSISCGFGEIGSIEPGAFSGLNLTVLDLTHCYQGRILHADTFSHFNVTTLKLEGNEIVEIRPEAFNGLRADLLLLSSNNITKIVNNAFAGLTVRDLDLTDNPVEEVEQDAFKNARVGVLKMDRKPNIFMPEV